MEQRTCKVCDRPLTKKPGPGRWPLYCEDHRVKRPPRPYVRRVRPKGPPIVVSLSCLRCDLEFEWVKKGNPPKFCGDECRIRYHLERQAAERAALRADTIRECPQCGDLFTPRRTLAQLFCSRRCGARALAERESRTCSVEGCGRKLRARGLCGSHYNQAYQPNRHTKVEVPCAVCGTVVLKFKAGRRQVCSDLCRYYLKMGKPHPGRAVAIYHSPPKVRTTEAPLNVLPSSRRGFAGGECAWCGEAYLFDFRTTGVIPRTCSRDCSERWASTHGHRFRPPLVQRMRIYERDGYECQICGEATDPSADPWSDWYPSLDHIVPRSQGGSDDDDNLRTAHRWCNAVRGDLSYYTDDDFAA